VTPEGSVSFDRAADYYDATRILPPETHAAMLGLVADELRDRGRCLEIGVGTGRIALPIVEAGLDLVGIDISSSMLRKLVEKAGTMPVELAVADATRLPFAADSFGGAFGVHVLHLIAGWREAARELVRVVRPGGTLLFDLGHADPTRLGVWQGPAHEIEQRFLLEAGIARRHPGITSTADLDDVLSESGAVPRDLPRVTGSMMLAPSVLLRLFEDGVFAWTWDIEPELRSRAAASVRAWATERYGDPDQPQRFDVVIAFRAYDLPA